MSAAQTRGRPVWLRQRLAVAGAVGLALALPAAAAAALLTVGALGRTATISYPEPVDTAFWTTAGRGGAPEAARHAGLVRLIRLRGCARPGPAGQAPLAQIHFQALSAGPGGTATVMATSGPLDIPVCGDGATVKTATTFVPGNLCVPKGGYVAFNDEGGGGPGFPAGVRYAVLGAAAGALTESFTQAGGTNNGDTLTGSPHRGVRLLMQAVIGTGRAAGVCG